MLGALCTLVRAPALGGEAVSAPRPELPPQASLEQIRELLQGAVAALSLELEERLAALEKTVKQVPRVTRKLLSERERKS